MWDSFRESKQVETSAVETNGHESETARDNEFPFIEIGADKFLAGSPDVMDCADASQDVPVFWPSATESAKTQPLRRLALSSLSEQERSVVEETEFAADLVAYHSPDSDLAREYVDALREMFTGFSEVGSRVLTFTSAVSSIPTTNVLLNFGLTAVRHAGRRVVVVDLSDRHPSVSELVGSAVVVGAFDVLAGRTNLARVLRRTPEPSLCVIGRGINDRTTSLRVPELQSLLQELRLRFDLVLVDAPRLDEEGDAIVVGSVSDAVYVIASEHAISDPEGKEAQRTLLQAGVPVGGCIVLK